MCPIVVVGPAVNGPRARRGGDQVADKKIKPKAAKKSTSKSSKTEAATRVTKRRARRARSSAK